MKTNAKDPLNVIICGVGGQGNLMASRLVAKAMAKKGYQVTIGETLGAAQRGGSVMSHLRISKERLYGPFIPRGKADVVVSLEPVEALRMLVTYGNPGVVTITNTHPSPPPFVEPAPGAPSTTTYPDLETLNQAIRDLSGTAKFVKATQIGTELGAPIVANMIMLGALIGVDKLPLSRAEMEAAIKDNFAPNRVELNFKAFARGLDAVN